MGTSTTGVNPENLKVKDNDEAKNLNNPLQYPMSPECAVSHFYEKLSPYEVKEIMSYKEIWFLGLEVDKRKESEEDKPKIDEAVESKDSKDPKPKEKEKDKNSTYNHNYD